MFIFTNFGVNLNNIKKCQSKELLSYILRINVGFIPYSVSRVLNAQDILHCKSCGYIISKYLCCCCNRYCYFIQIKMNHPCTRCKLIIVLLKDYDFFN